ncbi:MAG: hypothetical protein R6V55_11070, partial [Desulfovermiculus sp.]
PGDRERLPCLDPHGRCLGVEPELRQTQGVRGRPDALVPRAGGAGPGQGARGILRGLVGLLDARAPCPVARQVLLGAVEVGAQPDQRQCSTGALRLGLDAFQRCRLLIEGGQKLRRQCAGQLLRSLTF